MLVAEANGSRLLVDCGSGATLRISEADIPVGKIDAVLFTHFHADHCIDFPVFAMTSYLAGRTAPLTVYGPTGVARFVEMMFDQLFPYIPTLVSGLTGAPWDLVVKEVTPGGKFRIGAFSIQAGAAKHSVPSLCYRLDTGDEAMAVSGDTEATNVVADLARGCQLLVHECPFPVHMGHIPDHTQASDVGTIAARAGVSAVLLTHLFEDVVGHEEEMEQAIRRNYSGRIIFGADLMTLRLDRERVYS
jgi:ribonuclease BN (tRNA processing enzyme)